MYKMKVYKISHDNLTYYGSTCQPLCQRLAEHKYAYKTGSKKYNSSLVFALAKEQDKKVTIELVEEVEGTLSDLIAREKWYIANNTCVNKKAMSKEERNQKRKQRYLEKKQLKEQEKLLSPVSV